MARNTTPAMLLPLAAILAVAFPFAFSFRPAAQQQQETATPQRLRLQEPPAPNSPDKGKKQPAAVHDASKILNEFFGTDDLRQLRSPGSGFRGRYSVHYVIATVPDPTDSRLPYLFDRFLASIQRGAEAENFVLDRYDLPWLEEKQRANAEKEGSSSSSLSSAETASLHRHDKQPGLLLFRNAYAKNGPRLLVVFVVGETPTTGISKDAFTSALAQIAQLQEILGVDTPSRRLYIPILGPSFSGSAESLDFAVQSWLSNRQRSHDSQVPVDFKIVSGSATAIPTASTAAPDGRYYFAVAPELGTAEFRSTVLPDGPVALHRFVEFVTSREIRPSFTIAFLTEGNTAYGAAVKSAAQAETGAPDAVYLPFPLHISRLRSATEKTRRAREQSSQQVKANTDSSRYLPVPFDDESENARDSIPAVSDLDITSAELVLANLLSTISHEQCDYVGIAATDVRDTIFLAREIHERSPSSVIFSLNADLIYAHPEANPSTRGMLVVTPYPLFTLNQRWMDPVGGGVRLQFPDQNSEGVYNAMLLLVDKALRDDGSPLESGSGAPLLEYGVPFDRSSDKGRLNPPVWITTVGRQGFWPVAIFPPTDTDLDDYTHREPGSASPSKLSLVYLTRGMIPNVALLVYFCWSLLCLIPSVIVIWRYLRQRFPHSRFLAADLGVRELPAFREPTFPRNRGECSAYYLVGAVAALSAYLVAAAAFAITAHSIITYADSPSFSGEALYYHVAIALMLAVLVLSFVACLLLAGDSFSLVRNSNGQSANGWLAYPVLVIAVVGLGLAIWLSVGWLTLHVPGKPGLAEIVTRIVTGFRVLNIFSGVSPLPPLFFIALAACVWAYSAVRRVHLTESLPWTVASECGNQADTPDETNKYALFNSSGISFKTFRQLESEVQALLRCPSLHLPGGGRALSFVIALVILIAGVYLFYFRLVVALELPSVYVFFGVCFLLVYLSIALNTMRLFFLWLSLRKVLHALDRHPIRRAFARFHVSFPNLPRISLATAPSPLTALNFSIQQATALLRSAKCLLPAKGNLVCPAVTAKPHIDDAEARYREAVDAEVLKQSCKSLMAQLAAQRSLAHASSLIEEGLEHTWRLDPASPTPDPSIEEKREELVQEAEEFLVGRTVLFLSHVFPQMTNLAALSLAGLLLLLMAVSSYPFQPHQLIVFFIWLLIFSFVAVALSVFVQMNRDTLLSNLNGSKPGEINWDRDFVTRILLYVVIPILGFLGVQFPDVVAQIFSFLSPGAAGHG